jgi:2'-5' RNA ligase
MSAQGRAPFLMLLARPASEVSEALEEIAVATGLAARLGSRWFDRANWHQSFSDRHCDDSRTLHGLRQVGDALVASSFEIVLDRIASSGRERIDWRFEASGSKTPEFVRMIDALRAAFGASGVDDPVRHTPHLTFGYGAPEPIGPMRFPAIAWTIDRIELVRRRHDPYRYETLACWELRAASSHAARQAALF